MGDGALAIASSTCQLEMVKQLVRLGLCINERHEVLDDALTTFYLRIFRMVILHCIGRVRKEVLNEFLISAGAGLEAVDKVCLIVICYFCNYFTSVGIYTFSSRRSERRITCYGCSR